MKILVVGGSNIDYIGKSFAPLREYDSNPGMVEISFGGVARNIVENLANLGVELTFITAIGNDPLGVKMENQLKEKGVKVIKPDCSSFITASYLAIHDEKGEMEIAICDSLVTKLIDKEFLENYKSLIKESDYVVIDTNLSVETLGYLLTNYPNQKFICDTISTIKACKIKNYLDKIYLLKANEYEYDIIKNQAQMPKHLVVTRGSKNLYYYHESIKEEIKVEKVENIINATGAGDAFLAATIYGVINDYSFLQAFSLGLKASKLTLESEEAVSKNIADILKK